jgi:hypothetical protein
MGPTGPSHNPILCGLDIDGRPLCAACQTELRAALAAGTAAEARRRRRDSVRRALPSTVRRWLRRLVRREIRGLLLAELPEAHRYLHAEGSTDEQA